MKILLLGGTGTMGSFLTRILSERSNEVWVTSRYSRKEQEHVHYYKGNAHDTDFLVNILKLNNWDCIVDFMNYSTKEYQFRYKLLLDSTKQLVYISSSRVYAECNSKIVESSPRLLDISKDKKFLCTDDYALAKARQEDFLVKSACGNYTIIRPYMTYFKNRLDLGFYPKELWLKRVMENKKILFPLNVLEKRTTLTYGDDVAMGIASVIGQQSALGKVFHITQDHSITWQEVIGIYTKALKAHDLKLNLEYIENDECYGYINCYDRQYNRTFDNTSIKSYLDTSHFVNINDGITLCIDQFLKFPSFNHTNWCFYAQWDRVLNETEPLSRISGYKDKFYYLFFRYGFSVPTIKKLKHLF